MKPSLNKYYRVEELTLCNVMTLVLNEYGTFTNQELLHIHLLNTKFVRMIPKLLGWLKVNFLPLQELQYSYQNQMEIDPYQVLMANAGMAHFGLNPGNFVQWLEGKFTGQYCNVQATLAAVQGLISPDDYAHTEQILLDRRLSSSAKCWGATK